jgi:hypothetical protein
MDGFGDGRSELRQLFSVTHVNKIALSLHAPCAKMARRVAHFESAWQGNLN